MNEQEILDRLRASGYRLTTPRRTLVEVLLQADGPLTAEEIHRRARTAGADADLSTIYRNLATFCEMGWLEAVPGANGERHYQTHRGQEQRLSVLCLDCGQITAISAPSRLLNEAVRGIGFNVESLRVTMAAHCEHVCAHKVSEQ